MPVYLAIDIGNGECKAAICDAAGRPESIRSERGGKSLPSYVALTSEHQLLFGEDAREHGQVYPEQVAVGCKMHLADDTKRYFAGTASASDVVGLMARYIVSLAEKQTGQKVDGVVITVPANFTDEQRAGLVRGFESVGIRVIQVISEPAAAAYAYLCLKRLKLVACIDVGHGTTDVAVCEVDDENVASPIATEGMPQVGGRDFTEAVISLLLAEVSRETGKAISLDKIAADQRFDLYAKAEKAKHALGNQKATKVALNCAGRSSLIPVTQASYEEAIEPRVKEITACADRCLAGSNKTWQQLDMLILAGGPFQSNRLQERIADHTGLVPNVSIDPAVVVSFGAALHAKHLAARDGGGCVLPSGPVFGQTTDHDIGVVVEDESTGARALVCDVVVPKNTHTPSTVVRHYRLPSEASTEALIEIVQGPHGSPAHQCVQIGTINLTGLPREAQRTYRIEVSFKIDENTLCEVTARDMISGITQTVSVRLRKTV